MNADPCTGAVILGDDISLPEVWLTLHRSGVAWSKLVGLPDALPQQARITASDQALLRLLDTVPYPRWQAFTAACGPTATALLAGGWTKDAPLTQIAYHWGQHVLEYAQPFAPAARLVPAHLLPRFTRLSDAIPWAGDNLAVLALIIYAQPHMTLDLPPVHLTSAPPLLAAALAARHKP
ncbi:MAG: hypothetical protein RLZZ437_3371 [Pseudomonadota bacterium]|jgi:hypothetical protein